MCNNAIPAPLNYAPNGHHALSKIHWRLNQSSGMSRYPGDKVLKNGDIVNLTSLSSKMAITRKQPHDFMSAVPSIQAQASV